MTQTYDVCPWPVDAGCFDDVWESEFDNAVQTRAIALASSTLQRLTGYRVSNCLTRLRPCSGQSCGPIRSRYSYWAGHPPWMSPYNWNGTWFNACGCQPDMCGHTQTNTVWLPQPMGGVDTVWLDGNALDEDIDFRVVGNALIAIDPIVWPLTQDLTLPTTETNTFAVDFYNAIRPDGNAAYACAKLALQYARACTGNGKCDLPASVTSVVRQGVSFTLPSGSFPNGETGIREVDAFIALYNPKHRMVGPQAYVP